MNAAGIALVRSLVRMGVHVGTHVEHPMDLAAIDELAGRIAQPVIDALDPSTVFEVDAKDDAASGFPKGACESTHVAHGQCVLGAHHRGDHGTLDGGKIWHCWARL